MKRHALQAEIRTVLGSKVKNLRKAGKLPATVYGKGVENASISVDEAAFEKTFAETGETGLIDLSVGGSVRPVLIHTVQVDPITGTPVHIEFHQVNLKEKVHANVPVVVTGEPTAVKEGQGVLLTLINDIEVEALPAEIPEHIVVDVSALAAVDDQMTVGQLSIPATATLLTDPEVIVVKIGALRAAEPEAAPAPAEGEAAPAAEGETTPAAAEEVSKE